jgi:Zn-dependent protease
MNDLLAILLAITAAWLGLQVILLIAGTVQLLRLPIAPHRICRDDAALIPDQQATLDELHALGFELISLARHDIGERSYAAALLRHASQPAYAGVTFQPSPYSGYPVAFYSFDTQDRMLVTRNRVDWSAWLRLPDMLSVDPYADSLEAHWRAHEARLPQAVAIDSDRARERIWAAVEAWFEHLQAADLIVAAGSTWHLRLGVAARTALAMLRVRRKLARPYACAATTGPHQASYFAACYAEIEAHQAGQAARHNVKATVLVLSLVLSLVLWGVVFDWRQAAILMGVLLVHEGGHALAMRAFGWKDLSMFFVPFIGAMVTGKPTEVRAWKEAVVLLAGPLPGLLAGVALLLMPIVIPESAAAVERWRDVALIAIGVNLFNLLPITPLDGGRLVETALFSRWPRLRLLFAAFSVAAFAAMAVWWSHVALWVIVAVLVYALLGQWRIVQLQLAWQEGLPKQQQLAHLFEVVRGRLRVATFVRQLALVRAVFLQRLVHVPRLWERVLALSVLVCVWIATAAIALPSWPDHGGAAQHDPRSPAQQAFDEAWSELDDGEDAAKAHVLLRQRAAVLAPNDPRHVDLDVALAHAAPEQERRQRVAAVLARGADGLHWQLTSLLRYELRTTIDATRGLPPGNRLMQLQASLQWAEAAAPQTLAPTIDTRLRVAEALDESGDTPGAFALLQEIHRRAAAADDCRCELGSVLRAQAWFHLSHQQTEQALALLQQAASDGKAKPALALDRAWALHFAGRKDAALAAMRSTTYMQQSRVGWRERLRNGRATEPYLVYPLDLAFMLNAAGHAEEARALLSGREIWQCRAASFGRLSPYTQGLPWQRERDRLIEQVAVELCPATQPAAGLGSAFDERWRSATT